jgi:hypothetical protein
VYVALDGVRGSSGLLAAIAAHVARPLGSQAQVDLATANGTRRMALVLDDLDGLPVPAAGASLPDVLATDAVRLFVAHAQRLRPDYYLTDSSPHWNCWTITVPWHRGGLRC